MNLKSYQSLIENTQKNISIYANTASYIYQELPNINWAGFYFLQEDALYLGPFMGKPACTEINTQQGVCGKCIRQQKTILVNDVHQFEGHIACDSDSKSEMVLPLIINGKIIGVLDIDSPIYNRFTLEDQKVLEELVVILVETIKKQPIEVA